MSYGTNYRTMEYIQGDLFEGFDFSTLSPQIDSMSNDVAENRKIYNLHYCSDFSYEGVEDMPIVEPYIGPLPKQLIPFNNRKQAGPFDGVHCFVYDTRIEQAWTKPRLCLEQLKGCQCAIAPDYSLFVDMPRAINVTNVYRNRWVNYFWSSNGVKTIPSASWGAASSFSYCFDGLPTDSYIAIGHVAEGRDKPTRKLFRMGVEELIARKKPRKLIVYGAPLDFTPTVEVVYYEGFIQKLRRMKK